MKTILLITSLLLLTNVAHARIYIRIDEVAEKKFPIAINNLVNAGKSGDRKNWSKEVTKILKKDLSLTGLFEFVDPELYPGEDSKNYKPDSVKYPAWKLLGVQALIKGGFVYKGDGKVKAELYMYDPLVGQKLIGHEYSAKAGDYRNVAHHFADMIMEALTGYPGIFRTRIAFVAKNSSSKEIYTMGVDGAGVAKVTSDRNINLSPAFSPSGGKIAYTSYNEEGFAELKVVNLGSRAAKQITKNSGIILSPTWTPSGKFITAFVGDNGDNIYNISLGGKLVQRLTNHWSIDIGPSWAPGGGSFVFASERAGGLHIFRGGSGGVQRLTFVGYQNDNPDWSPDGERIVFQGRDQGVWDLFVMNPDGSLLQRLTAGAGSNAEPTWAPNSQYIGFSSSRRGGYGIYMMTAQGENQVRISKGGGMQPDWGPLPKK